MMKTTQERPSAAPGKTAYRYRYGFGWIMVDAKDQDDALKKVGVATCDEDYVPNLKHLEIWNGTEYEKIVTETEEEKRDKPMSREAQRILRHVLDAMQDAEEMGGTESTDDYVKLMTAIQHECAQRIANATSV
jgi:cobalamin biosynthesis Co2+ chelatase CbiK